MVTKKNSLKKINVESFLKNSIDRMNKKQKIMMKEYGFGKKDNKFIKIKLFTNEDFIRNK